MELSNLLDLLISSILILVFTNFIVAKVFDEKLNNNKNYIIIAIVLCAVFITLINYYDREVFKIVLTLPFF